MAPGRAGAGVRVVSAYRSYSTQQTVYQREVNKLGVRTARLRVARPGHSEHQLGTTLDISNTRGAYDWLARRAWRFGFVISYPPGERATSCYRNEPWHVRYVGRDRAARIRESGMVPRAWLWLNVVAPSLVPAAGRAV